jgi:hypothetical protein
VKFELWLASAVRGVRGARESRTDTVLAQAVLYQGLLHSDRRMLEVKNVYDECIVGFRTWSRDVRVMIWGDDPRQAERICGPVPRHGGGSRGVTASLMRPP